MRANRGADTSFVGHLRRLVRGLLEGDEAEWPGAAAGELQQAHPELTRDQVAQRLVQRYALRCGAVGAVTGMSGLPALGVTGPASLMSALALQVRMVLAIASVYGHTPRTRDFETDVLLIMAGDAAKEVAKRVGVDASRELAYRSLHRWAAQRTLRRLAEPPTGPVVVVGTPRSAAAARRFLPLVGAPVGFGMDWAYARAVGQRAIAYYRREPRPAGPDGFPP